MSEIIIHPRGSQAYYKQAGYNAWRLGSTAAACKIKDSQKRSWWMQGYHYAENKNVQPFKGHKRPEGKKK